MPFSHGRARLAERQILTAHRLSTAARVEDLESRVLFAAGTPTVAVRATDPTAAEAGRSTGTFEFTRAGGDTSQSLTIWYAASGSATPDADYAKLGSGITIPSGATSARITVKPIDDAASEGTESVNVKIQPSSRYAIGTGSATVTISDNDSGTPQPPPVPPGPVAVSVQAVDAQAAEEGRNTGIFEFARSGSGLSSSLTIWFATSGTANGGSDYAKLPSGVTIPAGATSVRVQVTPVDDAQAENAETVIVKVQTSSRYVVTTGTATVTIADNDSSNPPPGSGNHPPRTPVFIEPVFDGEVVNAADVHMETAPFSDPDSGDRQTASDFEIWTAGASPQRVWHVLGHAGLSINHVHFGDGVFEGPLAGRSQLNADTDYIVRARHYDDSKDPATQASAWSQRKFHTEPAQTPIPNAPQWTVDQPGYKVEKVPLRFATGESQFQLPVNIAFVANPGPHPSDPLFYVTELYGSVRVITRNLTVFTYANGLLNYDATGSFPGEGEQGLTGLAIEPKSGDLFVSGLYQEGSIRVPRVLRLHSSDGGLHASSKTEIIRMSSESQGQSHQVSNVSFGPDGKLYVHNGDGFQAPTALNLDSFRGKILRMNLDGSAPSDNPFYNKADGINARDYVYAYGFRNPFGGTWRASDGQHYEVENGSALDRFARVTRGTSYGWNGTGESMRTNALYNWNPPEAPVNVTFIEPGKFNGSGFPSSKFDHAFVTESGATYATGPQSRGKAISEFVIDANGKLTSGPRQLIHYTGSGKGTAAALAAGPDGLYFSDLYRDAGGSGAFPATTPGASILRIRYVGTSATAQDPSASAAIARRLSSPASIAISAAASRSDIALQADWRQDDDAAIER